MDTNVIVSNETKREELETMREALRLAQNALESVESVYDNEVGGICPWCKQGRWWSEEEWEDDNVKVASMKHLTTCPRALALKAIAEVRSE